VRQLRVLSSALRAEAKSIFPSLLLLSSLSAHRPTAHSCRQVSHFALPCHHTACTTSLCCCYYLRCLAAVIAALLLHASTAAACVHGLPLAAATAAAASLVEAATSDLIVSSQPQVGTHHQLCSAPPPDARHWHRLSVPCSGQLRLMLLSLEHCPASSFPSHCDILTPPHCW
jgi:hypothetical protein